MFTTNLILVEDRSTRNRGSLLKIAFRAQSEGFDDKRPRV